jgi:hypothetical protein
LAKRVECEIRNTQLTKGGDYSMFVAKKVALGCASALFIILSPVLTQAAKTPAMTSEEKLAESLWKMRAALNVGALQCQFDPALKTVANFNEIAKLHKSELDRSRATMEGRYRKLYGKGGLGAFDKYNTKIWNGFSSVTAQVPFCNKVSEVGAAAIATPTGALSVLANTKLPEILDVFPKPEAPVAAAKPVKKAVGKKKSKKRSKK